LENFIVIVSLVISLVKFKFPSLNSETEKFLWRRIADLENALRLLEKEGLLIFSDYLQIIYIVSFRSQ
jgi:hypothetical protein